MEYNKECVVCKKQFISNRIDKLSCSKECAKQREADLQRNRSEQHNQYQREKYAENPLKRKEYYLKNKEAITKKRKERYNINREKYLQQRKEYREKFPDKVKLTKKISYKKHEKENNIKANIYNQNYERKMKNSIRGLTRHFHTEEKKECNQCKSTENLEFHHPEPYTKENFQVLCRECHSKVTQENKQIPLNNIFN